MTAEEARALKAIKQHGLRPVDIDLNIQDWLVLIANLQLALRNPSNIGASSLAVRAIIVTLRAGFASLDPALGEIIDRGFDAKHDVPFVHTGAVKPGEFFLLSLKHSPVDDYAMWWGPEDCGYTIDLEEAGRYTAAQIAARLSCYNNGVDTVALPCEAVIAVAQVSRHVAYGTMKMFQKPQTEGQG